MSFTYNGTAVQGVTYNGAEVQSITYNGVEVWSAAKPYLSFIEEDNQPFTLKTNNTSKNWDGTLYYSTDAKNWSEWNGTEISSSNNGKLYVRGKGNTHITEYSFGSISSSYKKDWVLTSGKRIKCQGNIENLLDYETVEQGSHPVMEGPCYWSMFRDCTSLTQAPELPATTLAKHCYENMFKGCTNLTQAPELPATMLAEDCYGGIFSGCTNLTQAPELPATMLASRCYQYMFENCTSLTSVPSLPATTLPDWCYWSMFQGCTKLTQAPELPATTLADSCYKTMFSGCASLTGQIHCASSTSENSYRLKAGDIKGSSATIVFDL